MWRARSRGIIRIDALERLVCVVAVLGWGFSKSFLKTFNQSFFASAKKDWERKQPQGVATPWEFPGEGAFALLEAQKLRTHGTFHNARHIKRAAFFRWRAFVYAVGLPSKGKVRSLGEKILFGCTDQMGLRIEVILWRFDCSTLPRYSMVLGLIDLMKQKHYQKIQKANIL